jgi:predicted RNA binding protein YcfA (HicA-like mRNA interferase family)
MNGFYQSVTDLLKEHGFRFHRPGKGSHEIWIKGEVKVTVQRNLLSRHTANEVMKQAGIAFKF